MEIHDGIEIRDKMKIPDTGRVSRRDFLSVTGFAIAGISFSGYRVLSAGDGRNSRIRFGIVTDTHYADRDHNGNRYYRESIAKMRECVRRMNREDVSFLIELGDFKDEGSPPAESSTIDYLRAIEREFSRFRGDRYHVLGNHDTDSISKEQFLANISNTGVQCNSRYYSFDSGGVHFIVLDANYRSDGLDYDCGNFDWTDANVPGPQLDWLDRDLASTPNPSIVFIHQQLDGTGDHYIKNAAEVRLVLEKHRKVLTVFQGHNHAGHYSLIEGIHYYTLKAMVEGSGEENNSFAIVEVHDDLGMTVTGFRQAVSMKLKKNDNE
jgi:predicted phosphodiesterase